MSSKSVKMTALTTPASLMPSELPSNAYPLWTRILRVLTRVFFARIEITGTEHVPEDGGGVVVAWHPNGLVDGLLILAYTPRPVVFGARSGLFETPILGWVLRSLGTVPLYRAQDLEESDDKGDAEARRREANEKSLGALSDSASRYFVAIFPEGVTHDESHLVGLRTGAARLVLRAKRRVAERPGGVDPVVLPVGLHYDKKHAFRSRVLVSFHPPLDLESYDPSSAPTESVASDDDHDVRDLTSQIESTLNAVVQPTESWRQFHTMERARRLVRAERAARFGARLTAADLEERAIGFARIWHGYHARKATDPETTERVMSRIRRYDEALRLLRLDDRDLDKGAARRRLPRFLLVLAEAFLVFIVMPPFVLIGYAVSLPTALLLKLTAKKLSTSRKEQAGLKLALGALAIPTTWILLALLVTFVWPRFWSDFAWAPQSRLFIGAFTIVVCAIGCGLALRYQRLAGELLRGIRTLLVRSTRVDAVTRLRQRRSKLHDDIMELAEGLDLPGELRADGRLRAEAPPIRQ